MFRDTLNGQQGRGDCRRLNLINIESMVQTDCMIVTVMTSGHTGAGCYFGPPVKLARSLATSHTALVYSRPPIVASARDGTGSEL